MVISLISNRDQPQAIEKLSEGVLKGTPSQVLLGGDRLRQEQTKGASKLIQT